MYLRKSIVALSIVILFAQCKHEPLMPEWANTPTLSAICDPDTVYFVSEILPLINSNCATSGCHDAQTAEHGVVLTDYVNIYNTGEIKAGDPVESELYEVLSESGDDRMPPSPQAAFTNEQKELVRKWISQGAKNNSCEDGCDLTSVGFAADIMPIITTNCLGCHSGPTPNGNTLLTNYTEVAAVANSGRLLEVITGHNNAPQMPPSGSLNDCNIDKISLWIQAGALDD